MMMMTMNQLKSVKDFNVKNKKVLVRCDFNVPFDQKGTILDDFRILQTIPTLTFLQEQGAKLLLMTHLTKERSLIPIKKRLEKHLKDFTLLDNLRLDKREEENDQGFAQELAGLADIYINDAFGVCHRNHASIVGVAKYLSSGAGLLLEKEIRLLSRALENPSRPLVVIIGGAKVKSKAKAINQFLKIADQILIGGKTAYKIDLKSDKIYLPFNHKKDLDIGPETITRFSQFIKKAKIIIWAGPLGCFENPLYEKGTKEIAQEIVRNKKAFKIAGGGDTIFALAKFGLRDKFDHVSTGGGAMLSFLSGEKLPGLEALGYYG